MRAISARSFSVIRLFGAAVPGSCSSGALLCRTGRPPALARILFRELERPIRARVRPAEKRSPEIERPARDAQGSPHPHRRLPAFAHSTARRNQLAASTIAARPSKSAIAAGGVDASAVTGATGPTTTLVHAAAALTSRSEAEREAVRLWTTRALLPTETAREATIDRAQVVLLGVARHTLELTGVHRGVRVIAVRTDVRGARSDTARDARARAPAVVVVVFVANARDPFVDGAVAVVVCVIAELGLAGVHRFFRVVAVGAAVEAAVGRRIRAA